MNLNDGRKPELTTADVAGVWSRVWEEDPIGCDSTQADTTTLVLWTQAPGTTGIYIDIRLPLSAPGRSIETARSFGYDPTEKPNPEALHATGMTLPPPPPLVESTSSRNGNNNSDDDDDDDDDDKEASSSNGNRKKISELVSSMTNVKSFAGKLEYTIGDATKSGEALLIDQELARLVATADKMRTEGGAKQQQQQQQQLPPVSTCYWERVVDYQPPTGGFDIGVCAPSIPIHNNDDEDINSNKNVEELLRETGDDGSYAELWRRLPGSSPSSSSLPDGSKSSSKPSVSFAMELLSEEMNGNGKVQRHGYWVRTNQYFAYVVGRPNTSEDAVKLGCVPQSSMLMNRSTRPSQSSDDQDDDNDAVVVVGKSLKDAIETIVPIPPSRDDTPTTNHPEDIVLAAKLLQLRVLGSYVCLFGTIDDDNEDDGSNKWTILHSTDPGLLGCTLVGGGSTKTTGKEGKNDDGRCCSTVSLTPDCKNLEVGATIVQSVTGETSRFRHWKVVEIDGPTGLPGL